MKRIDRRQLLKTAAAVGGAALGVEALGGSTAFAAPPPGRFAPTGISNLAPPVATPGTTYKYYNGTGFHPMSNIAYNWVNGIAAYVPSGSTDYFIKDVEVPNGAVVTECSFDIINNDASGSDIYIYHWIPSSGLSPDFQATTVTTLNAGIQSVPLNPAPFTVDTTMGNVALYWRPHVAATTQQLYGARVGWMLEPGLTLFPDPRRCLGNGATTPAEGFILNIDATQKVLAAGPTGVPAGAKAAFCAVQSYQPGIMTLYPAGTPDTGIANWSVYGSTGQLQLLYMMVPLDSTGKFNIHNRFTGKQIYVDVWGFVV